MTSRLVPLGMMFALAVAACSGSSTSATGGESVLEPDEPVGVRIGSFAGTEPAPEFPGDLDWLNVARPLDLAELRGKVVLLDFWTYGCINCIHIIPDLKRLEAEYPDELVVIGVHSAKFDNEGDTDNIRDIVARYDIGHPVVNDRDFEVWQLWGVQAWPTLVLIDPAGNVVGGHSGEGIYAVLQPVIDSLVEEFDEQSRIDRTPLELVLEKDRLPNSVLSFPGKVLADPVDGRLFIADTNHHRILLTDLETGEIVDVVGSGVAGYGDGSFESALFDQPQGMALSEDGGTLYVADTGSHAIRSLDLRDRSVSTLLGTGDQATAYPPLSGRAPELAISSPWDVAVEGSTMYIAMAGSHQIWTMDLTTGEAEWYVGSGRESTVNGPRLAAELAQPSAVVVLPDGSVAFADSESSSIRAASPGPSGLTSVIAGSDVNLFDFGDLDGFGAEARLQHPLGLDYGDGVLWVADTYNSKIKKLDPTSLEIVTAFGGEQGWSDGSGGSSSFSEPGGLSYAEGKLYVADTNNHAIRIIDLETGEVATRVLFGIERFPTPAGDGPSTIDLGVVEVNPGEGSVVLDVVVPEGYKVNDLAPFSMRWEGSGAIVADGDRSIVAPVFPLELEAEFTGGTIAADLTIYYCEIEAQQLCLVEMVRIEAMIDTVVGGPPVAHFAHEIELPSS
jgi:DNA-binding beta-propeller fold protein YncE